MQVKLQSHLERSDKSRLGSGYYAQSNADKIVIKKWQKINYFIKNQDGRWELLTGEPDIRGISAKMTEAPF